MHYVAKRKRVVHLNNREIDFGDFYLSDFIIPNSLASHEIFAYAWGRLSKFFAENPDYARKIEKIIGLDNMVVKELWNVVNVKVKYRGDDPVFNVPEFWELPNEAWSLGADCEGTSFLLESAILGFKRDAEAYACLGFYVDPYSRQVYGHGWVIYRPEPRFYDGWLWLESTLESAVSQSVWYVWNPTYLVPVYFFNSKEAYRIDKDYEILGLDEKYVEAYKDLIKIMIDYVEAGKWIPHKWMHKGRRTPKTMEKIILPK
ncbi:hypothetical protein DRJ17_07700 [Candidatus Woesearchaeota archaeon]|nr:MAG: hypothetical protein DRJ17_07700 [Candidatus Woesearchaeota archaeon]